MLGVPRKGAELGGWSEEPPSSLCLLLSPVRGQPCAGLTGGTPRVCQESHGCRSEILSAFRERRLELYLGSSPSPFAEDFSGLDLCAPTGKFCWEDCCVGQKEMPFRSPRAPSGGARAGGAGWEELGEASQGLDASPSASALWAVPGKSPLSVSLPWSRLPGNLNCTAILLTKLLTAFLSESGF